MVKQSQAIGSYAEANRQAWNYLAGARSSSSTPWPAGEPGERRAWLDEYGWLPWRRLRTVLIVCGAGGIVAAGTSTGAENSDVLL